MGGAPTARGLLWGALTQGGLIHSEVRREGTKMKSLPTLSQMVLSQRYRIAGVHRWYRGNLEVEKHRAIRSKWLPNEGSLPETGELQKPQSTQCFAEGETEDREGEGTCLRSHSQSVVEPHGLGSPGPGPPPCPEK